MSQQPKITGTRYVLAVQDLKLSASYYQQQLGFSTVWEGGGWHFLKREKFFLMLGECKDDVSAFDTNNHSYYAYVDVEEIDALYDEYQSREVEILRPIADQPWGQREFPIRTINGHHIMFGQKIDATYSE